MALALPAVERLGDHARGEVRGLAGRERHDELHGLVGVLLRGGHRAEGQERAGDGCACDARQHD